MLNSRSIQGILVLLVGLFLAIWLGQSIVTNQLETIFQVIAALVLIGCLFMGRKIWLLIPFGMYLNIGLRIPGQPDSLLLAQMLVLGFSTLLLLMRKLPFRLAWTELEFWAVLLTLFVLQVYLRNPVGVNIFGGDTVGGKPYAIYAIGLTSSLLLAGLTVPVHQLIWVFRLGVLGGLSNLFVSALGTISPTIGYYTGAVYETPGDAAGVGQAVDAGAANRIPYLSEFSRNLSLWISSVISPLRACLHPLWAFLVLITLVSAMMGGFRSGIMTVGITYVISLAYRSGPSSLILSLFALAAGVALLAVANVIHPLPPNIQRALTFLPGTWEQRYKDDAKGSTEWRVEMWQEALLTERWIHNKWIGDGLGFSADDLAKSFTLKRGSATSGFDLQREQMLINGDYHSSAVSTIRTIGYFGLLVLLLAQFRLAVHAHRLVKRYRNTTFYSLCLFVAIPLISTPILFFLSALSFGGVASSLILGIGMVRLLQKNLPVPEPVAVVPIARPLGIRNRKALQAVSNPEIR